MEDYSYHYEENYHPLSDSRRILGALWGFFPKIDSVADIGCGTGTFLHAAKELGASKVLGFDGSWVPIKLREEHLAAEEFAVCDFSKERISTSERFDLALSLEVGEHLPASRAKELIEDLTGLSQIVLFSAAIPGQDGQGHINEQWPQYWGDLFADEGYICADVVRPLIWNMGEVSYWYKQNMFLAVHRSKKSLIEKFLVDWTSPRGEIMSFVHPDQLADARKKYRTHQDLVFSGGLKSRSYLYLMLKSFLSRSKK